MSGVSKSPERLRNPAVGADAFVHQTMVLDGGAALPDNDMWHPENSDSLITNTSPYTAILNGPGLEILTDMDTSFQAASVIPVGQDSTPSSEKRQTLPMSTIETPFAPMVGLDFDEAAPAEWNHGDFPLMDEIWELPLQVC